MKAPLRSRHLRYPYAVKWRLWNAWHWRKIDTGIRFRFSHRMTGLPISDYRRFERVADRMRMNRLMAKRPNVAAERAQVIAS